MGKQRSKILRRRAQELMNLYPDKFNVDFENNKKILEGLNIFYSTISRNIVAGILVRLSVNEEL